MKRFAQTATMLLLAVVLAGGCLLGRHGHVARISPPALMVAGVVAAAAASRAGQVWVDGHWDRVGGGWVWRDGYWIDARPGMVWIQGGWIASGPSFTYRPGRWEPAHLHVR